MTVSPFPRPRIPRWAVITAIAVIVVLSFGRRVATFMTDVWWFDSVGYTGVFWTGLRAQLTLALIFGVLGILIVGVNLAMVLRSAPAPTLFRPDDPVARVRAQAQPIARRVVVWTTAAVGLIAGLGMTAAWRSYLLAKNAVDVGSSDPVFGRDLGYYMFTLPFQRAIVTWLFGILFVSLLLSVLGHLVLGGIQPEAPAGRRVPGSVRAHLSVLAGVLILLQAFTYRLDQYQLLYSERGQVTGASYTDVNAELPALKLLVIIAVVCAILFFANAWFRNWALPGSGLALLLLTAIIAGGIYPAVVQRIRVTPNEQELEQPFIQRNIDATRLGFGLDDVAIEAFPARDATVTDVAENPETISNVRLWDPARLHDTFLTLQRVTQFYDFNDVDVDRYEVEGERRLVMLSARELDLAGLQSKARTWLNEHLVYTHGYGIVASRVDRVTGEGQPSLVAQNIPLETRQGMAEVSQARIYFGEVHDQAYAVVGGAQEELDYPLGAGESSASTRYEGSGGVAMGSLFRRAMFAWRFGDVNLLISGAVTGQPRILFNRAILERVHKVLPFAELDQDPYIAVVDGRLTWIVDGYTTSEHLPYAERIEFGEVSSKLFGHGNYVRNSLKITVDAENGNIDAYAWDENDPVLRAWRNVYPDVVKERSAIPAGVLEHVRYPEGLFEVQTEMWGTYHIDDANNFYSKQDAWRIAGDPTQAPGSRVPAYYVLLRLPGEEEATFTLVRPFTPNQRQNLTGYMIARADAGAKYGDLVTYRFQSDQVFGPEQVASRINNDPVISPTLSLLDQGGSNVIRGNLLIMPLNGSLLYVQPIYVQGEGSALPELKLVAVVSGETIKAAPTLREALDLVFGEAPPPSPGPGPGPAPSADVAELLAQAVAADEAAQAALRAGDFAEYGRQQERLSRLLRRAAEESEES